jgi:periplasmic protein TonB
MNFDQLQKQKSLLKRRDRVSMDWAILLAIILHILILYLPPIAQFDSTRDWEREQREFMQMQRYVPPPPPPEELPEEPQVQKREQRLANPVPQQEPVDLDLLATSEDDFDLVFDFDDLDFDEPEPLPDEPLRVGGNVQPPTIIQRVEPKYPEIARRTGIQGMVILEAVIDRTGNVRDVKVVRSLNSLCDEAAIEAVRQWKFEPGTQNDIPIDVIMSLTVQFTLRR